MGKSKELAAFTDVGGTIDGTLTVDGGYTDLETQDTNNYARVTTLNGSAQLGLYRSGAGAGGFYIGGDADKFRVYDSSFTSRMEVDASGRVTMPYQPVFEAEGGTAHTVYNEGVRIFTAARINQGGHYSTTTGRFTAPIAGKYFFFTNLDYLESSTGSAAFYIRKNGSSHTLYDHHDWGSGWMNHNLQAIISLSAGDYVDVYGRTAHIAMDNWSNFGGYLIG